jgi:hypothetical protein
LLSFDDVRRELVANNRLHRGTRVVEADEIVGSVGRWRDFDRSFLPARASVGHKWKRIDRAFHRTEDLPPVELYKLEEAYFVVDGHHRVSVARYHEVPTVEAAVVEVHPKLPAAPVPSTSKMEEARRRPCLWREGIRLVGGVFTFTPSRWFFSETRGGGHF